MLVLHCFVIIKKKQKIVMLNFHVNNVNDIDRGNLTFDKIGQFKILSPHCENFFWGTRPMRVIV